MANYQNHLIDPSYFYDAIEEFAFNYDLYSVIEENIDEYGRQKQSFTHQIIRGSLQTEGLSFRQSKQGNHYKNEYNFYCKSLYKINIGDIIDYKGKYLQVQSVHEYDEWGVRECGLEMIQISARKDLMDYINYIKGEKIV